MLFHMTQIPTPLLYVLVALAAVGFAMVLAKFLRNIRAREDNPMTEIPSQLAPPGNAPPGYKWILVPDDD
jgi:hypothetical protein